MHHGDDVKLVERPTLGRTQADDGFNGNPGSSSSVVAAPDDGGDAAGHGSTMDEYRVSTCCLAFASCLMDRWRIGDKDGDKRERWSLEVEDNLEGQYGLCTHISLSQTIKMKILLRVVSSSKEPWLYNGTGQIVDWAVCIVQFHN